MIIQWLHNDCQKLKYLFILLSWALTNDKKNCTKKPKYFSSWVIFELHSNMKGQSKKKRNQAGVVEW